MKNIHFSSTTAVLLMLGTAAVGAQSQNPGPEAPRTGEATTRPESRATHLADVEFAQKAAMGGKQEVESATFAANKASNGDVKALASRLVSDHTKANEELTRMMRARKHASAEDTAPLAAVESWRNQTGAAFDRAYVDHLIEEHQKDIALFEQESTKGTDAELRSWATQKLPTLREHLKMAQDVKSKLGSTTR